MENVSENRELTIKAVEVNGMASVEIKGFASDGMLIAILKDVTENLYKRRMSNIVSIEK